MKTSLLISSLLLASGGALSQNPLSVHNLSVERRGSEVEVSFDAVQAPAAFKTNRSYTYTPSLCIEGISIQMPSILFGSRRSKILLQRKGTNVQQFYHKGDTAHYRYSLSYSEWMANCSLVIVPTVTGCGRTVAVESLLLAQALLPTPEVSESSCQELPPPKTAIFSVGEQMAYKYSFVAPLSAFIDKDGHPLLDLSLPLTMGKTSDPTQQRAIDNYLSQHEAGSLRVCFTLSSSEIDASYLENKQALKELAEAVNAICSSADSKVAHVVIAGFASPEGKLNMNDRLAWNRALALKHYLVANTSIQDEQIIHLYNGSENWMGLRKLVEESNMEDRDRVLHIIDTIPVNQGREVQLMKLSAGHPYRYMMQHLFPQLRHAAYIRVYYQDGK